MKLTRLFITLALALVGAVGTEAIVSAAEKGKSDTPNVVLLISDDQAWNDYGFMGHEEIETPHLDKLARESLTFKRGYVPDSLCRPSLVTMVTGLYPHQHGVVGNDPPPPARLANAPKGKQYRDPEYLEIRNTYLRHILDDPRLAEILKQKGYVSHQSGKWWEGHYSQGGFTDGMTHGDRTRGGRHGDLGLKIGREGLKPVKDFVRKAEKDGNPFFVYYAPFLPHTPHNPPERLLKKYRDRTPHLPVAKYWAMCEWFDETIGELVNFIDDSGLGEDTVFVYVTDNGWINQTDASRYAPRSKRSQYEGGVRTPIMVRWTGKVQPEMNEHNLASSIDIVPTVLSAVGLEDAITPEMEGINLLDAKAVAAREAIYGEIFEHDIQHMTDPEPSLRFRWMIDGYWKLIVPHPAREPEAKVELFNLQNDPWEEKNLADKHPERVKQLTRMLNDWWTP
ncbi:sulfatase family protein [Rubinisphaera brasiliensis]|uniref:Sulfatase n=1 Tax=Rubinisphaera brasiliensis (strain ATCC 49424 / DSM 5305 / JCM 21570 / IAM 15109 / NBRC 103401 / IFAM 1448) TaxID=756272 RepID=F0SFM3_RUBBR|nr:sulfatase [Rubinisphaera brasiliensis]ADY60483.1 sulfatase [Rubinisphaera brasiliensis DSM 5305]